MDIKELFIDNSILDKLSELEDEIAIFYFGIEKYAATPELLETIKILKEESRKHAIQFTKLLGGDKHPKFNDDLFYDIVKEVKHSLISEVHDTPSLLENLERCAKTEELIGKLYKNLASFYEQEAAYYAKFAAKINKIADEEFIHAERLEFHFDLMPPAKKVK